MCCAPVSRYFCKHAVPPWCMPSGSGRPGEVPRAAEPPSLNLRSPHQLSFPGCLRPCYEIHAANIVGHVRAGIHDLGVKRTLGAYSTGTPNALSPADPRELGSPDRNHPPDSQVRLPPPPCQEPAALGTLHPCGPEWLRDDGSLGGFPATGLELGHLQGGVAGNENRGSCDTEAALGAETPEHRLREMERGPGSWGCWTSGCRAGRMSRSVMKVSMVCSGYGHREPLCDVLLDIEKVTVSLGPRQTQGPTLSPAE